MSNVIIKKSEGTVVQYHEAHVRATARFVKVTAITGGTLPAWHKHQAALRLYLLMR